MKRLLALALVMFVASCGGGGSSPTAPSTPTPTPTPAARAVVVSGIQNNFFTVTSTQQIGRLVLKCGNFDAESVLGETAGLGTRLVRTDVYLLEADGDIDERRVVEDRPLAIPAHGSGTVTMERFSCGYVGRDLPMTLVGTFDFVDDRNNTQQIKFSVGFQER